MLDKPDEVGYDERQAWYDERTSISAGLFARDATAFTLSVMTWRVRFRDQSDIGSTTGVVLSPPAQGGGMEEST